MNTDNETANRLIVDKLISDFLHLKSQDAETANFLSTESTGTIRNVKFGPITRFSINRKGILSYIEGTIAVGYGGKSIDSDKSDMKCKKCGKYIGQIKVGYTDFVEIEILCPECST